MGWVSFIDPFLFKDNRLHFYSKNNIVRSFIPNIKNGKVIEIVDNNTIKIAVIAPYSIASIRSYVLELKDVVRRPLAIDDSSHWKNYTLYHYLQKTLMGEIIQVRNLMVNAKGVLLGDVYLGENHINKIVIDIGLATDKRVKFSDEV
jgi:hypothetical protein|tara:strand:- start:3451 stop:3891 length:441 start_codon:yes stop_codon:yes gene_type:complete